MADNKANTITNHINASFVRADEFLAFCGIVHLTIPLNINDTQGISYQVKRVKYSIEEINRPAKFNGILSLISSPCMYAGSPWLFFCENGTQVKSTREKREVQKRLTSNKQEPSS